MLSSVVNVSVRKYDARARNGAILSSSNYECRENNSRQQQLCEFGAPDAKMMLHGGAIRDISVIKLISAHQRSGLMSRT
jgi:hypothetical protein